MQSWFHDVADHVESLLSEGEQVTVSLSGEVTGFSRISSGAVRQSGSVEQRNVTIALRKDGREIKSNVMLAGSLATDRAPLQAIVDRLSSAVSDLPVDPHLPDFPDPTSDEQRGQGRIPVAEELIDAIAGNEGSAETCGIAITGTIYRGVATSLGSRRWYEAPRTVIDGSMHLPEGGASKWVWAGDHWNPSAARANRDHAKSMLDILARPVESPPIGSYRTWLEPAALEDLLGPLLWHGAFSAKAVLTGSSPLAPLYDQIRLDPRVTIRENPAALGAPVFAAHGHTNQRLDLISEGAGNQKLTSPRTAVEHDLDHNGAAAGEFPGALEMDPGQFDPANACAQVGDGLWLSHVHYTNLAAREGARVTGVTRWIALRVKDGEPVAPIGTVRIDDSLIRLLGEGLMEIGAVSEPLPMLHTYHERKSGGFKLPGILVEGLRVVG
ncbi:MAG: metallopeptidase TldD-related protein [Planctomycetota bacterium]|nr:metallopeptidase TldD-related protein [Planctomycetota bacterium]